MTGECPDYKSPFKLPSELECSNPYDADHCGYSHSRAGERGYNHWGKACPVHSVRLTGERQGWQQWAQWREEYANPENDKTGRDLAMQEMLACVTPDCPPDAPPREQIRTKTKTRAVTWHDIDGRPHTYVKQKRRPSDGKLVAVSLLAVWLVIVCFAAVILF